MEEIPKLIFPFYSKLMINYLLIIDKLWRMLYLCSLRMLHSHYLFWHHHGMILLEEEFKTSGYLVGVLLRVDGIIYIHFEFRRTMPVKIEDQVDVVVVL